MNHRNLTDLYHATEENLLFGVGQLVLPDQEPTALIQTYYRDWSRQKLQIVQDSFHNGLVLTCTRRSTNTFGLHISTCEYVTVRATQGGHTSVLRAPAWDAHLAAIEEHVFRGFVADRRRLGGFLVLVQTPDWEFLTAVGDVCSTTNVGPVLPRSFPEPIA